MKDYLSQPRPKVQGDDELARALAAIHLGIVNVKEIKHDDMTGAVFVQDEDGLWYGVKGMKWGVSRSSAQLRSAAAERAKTTPAAKPASSSSSGESSSARYERLRQQAKAGKANSLSDDDLRFFNARTEALRKVAALNQTEPGWLSKATKKVAQTAAEKTMQEVTNAAANKYITVPLTRRIAAAGAAAAT